MAAVDGHGSSPGQLKGAVDGGKIWWVVPDPKTAAEVWRDLKRACRGALEDPHDKSETQQRIQLPGGGSVEIRSAHDPDNLRGQGLDGIVVDEAAIINEDAWNLALRPALADRKGWAIFISSPKGFNWFYNLFRDAEFLDNWGRWQRPSTDNPLLTPEEVADMTRQMTAHAIQQEVYAKFEAENSGMFKLEDLTRRAERAPDHRVHKLRAIRYWDEAASATGDESAGALLIDCDGIIYVADVISGHWTWEARNKVIEATAEMDCINFPGCQLWIEELFGAGGKVSVAVSAKHFRRFGVHFDKEGPRKSKVKRAEVFAAAVERGEVVFVRGEWNKKAIDQLCSFPPAKDGAAVDDIVDAIVGAYNKLVLSDAPSNDAPTFSPAMQAGATRPMPRGFGRRVF